MNTKWMFFFCAVCLYFLVLFYFLNYHHYQRGLQLIQKEDYNLAKKEFEEVLSSRPSYFLARLNLAWLEALQKNDEKAFRQYSLVFNESLKKQDRFQARFNSAVLQKNNVDSALSHYQSALKEEPESLKVKTNIELLLKQKENSTKEQGSTKEQDSKNSNQDSLSQEDSQSEESQGRPEWKKQDNLDPDQIQSLLKEIEKKEQKLKYKLNEKTPSQKGDRQW